MDAKGPDKDKALFVDSQGHEVRFIVNWAAMWLVGCIEQDTSQT